MFFKHALFSRRESLGEACWCRGPDEYEQVDVSNPIRIALTVLSRGVTFFGHDGLHDVRRNILTHILWLRTRKTSRLRSPVAVEQPCSVPSCLLITYPVHSCRSSLTERILISQKRWLTICSPYIHMRPLHFEIRTARSSATGLGMWECGEDGLMLVID